MARDDQRKELLYQVWGWIIFLICAFLFTASSVKIGDMLMIVASLFFVLGCIVFMIPLIKKFRE